MAAYSARRADPTANSMKWENLRNNKCPDCGKALYGVNGQIACSSRKCGFRISEERMSQIVMQRNERQVMSGFCMHGYNPAACAACEPRRKALI